MFREVKSAVDFLANILRTAKVNLKSIEIFQRTLQTLLCNRYQDHWFPEKPFKGSGYRCIRINHKMDPLITQAGSACDLSRERLHKFLPHELTVWIDPKDVSYRIGEEGSVGLLYSAPGASTSGYGSTSGSPQSSPANGSPIPQNWSQTSVHGSCNEQQLNLNNLIHSDKMTNLGHLAQYVSS